MGRVPWDDPVDAVGRGRIDREDRRLILMPNGAHEIFQQDFPGVNWVQQLGGLPRPAFFSAFNDK
jgi:hypothetical protein